MPLPPCKYGLALLPPDRPGGERPTIYCNQPSNGWLDSWGRRSGYTNDRCKEHQFPHALPLVLNLRLVQFLWRTTGYLEPKTPAMLDAEWLAELADLGVAPA